MRTLPDASIATWLAVITPGPITLDTSYNSTDRYPPTVVVRSPSSITFMSNADVPEPPPLYVPNTKLPAVRSALMCVWLAPVLFVPNTSNSPAPAPGVASDTIIGALMNTFSPARKTLVLPLSAITAIGVSIFTMPLASLLVECAALK